MSSARSEKLVLTYDNTRLTDGAGAQLQRIYGIYSISRLLGVSYLHTSLGRVGYQGLSALERNAGNDSFHTEFNALCRIKSDPIRKGQYRSIKIKKISPQSFRQLVSMSEAAAPPLLVQLAQPYGIADGFPDCYEICRQISPFTSEKGPRRLRVALHVRRGELFVVSSDRMLPNSYYINVALNVRRILDELAIDYVIEVHTEVAEGEFTVRPGHHGIDNRITEAVVVSPAMSRLGEFEVLPNLVFCINERAIDTLRKLATAEVLVMSRSSFSYVAAILNKNGSVLYHPFWHPPLSSWLMVDPKHQFDQARFRKGMQILHAQLNA